MATTNLVTKSLGNLLIGSGSGTPDHQPNFSSLYFRQLENGFYKYSPVITGNTSGVTREWVEVPEMISVSINSIQPSGNFSSSTSTDWFTISGSQYNWSATSNNGFSVNNGKITLTATSGTFQYDIYVSIKYTSMLTLFRVGLGKNGLIPTEGNYANSSLFSATHLYNNVNVFGFIDLSVGETVEIGVNTPNSTAGRAYFSAATLNLRLVT